MFGLPSFSSAAYFDDTRSGKIPHAPDGAGSLTAVAAIMILKTQVEMSSAIQGTVNTGPARKREFCNISFHCSHLINNFKIEVTPMMVYGEQPCSSFHSKTDH
jgi:hypothetical protein